MERIEYRDVVDKTTWPRGEWDNEPDKIQWQDEATGLPCLIVRNDGGALCGYVGITDNHPCYEKGYSSIDVEVHGGLTFSDACKPNADEKRDICHRPGEGEPDHVWWFGFDCAHCWDMSPGYRSLYKDRPDMLDSKEIYRNVEYLEEECRKLAQQLNAQR